MTLDPDAMQQLLREIRDSLREIEAHQQSSEQWQAATARSVRNLYKGISAAEENRTGDHDRFAAAEKQLAEMRASVDAMEVAVLKAAATTMEQVLSTVSPDDLARLTPIEVINRARAIQWAWKQGHYVPEGVIKDPPPLPPAPIDLVSTGRHGRRDSDPGARNDDSISFVKQKDGSTRIKTNINVRTLKSWMIAAATAIGVAVWEIVKTIRELGGHR